MDLLQTGDGIAKLPFHQMYVIDLSMSQEAIINHLLGAIMKIERPEFEGQRKSAANDLIQTQEDINKEEVINSIFYFTKLLLSSSLAFPVICVCRNSFGFLSSTLSHLIAPPSSAHTSHISIT